MHSNDTAQRVHISRRQIDRMKDVAELKSKVGWLVRVDRPF